MKFKFILLALTEAESPFWRPIKYSLSGGKKFEPLWNFIIQAKRLGLMTPLLEAILSKVSKQERKQSLEVISEDVA